MKVQEAKVHTTPIMLLSAKMTTFFLITNIFLRKIQNSVKKKQSESFFNNLIRFY